MSTRPHTLAISLVSHTNIGKTTLARTLLGRDVGSVRDATHVTEFADAHVMIETRSEPREQLMLWDTPGFGDSLRLVKRMRQSGSPLGWFMSEVWDRWRDRAFWASQQALRNVREEADVVLYLVSAAEAPQAAGYVAPEMELLAWTGLPVVVLLNQLGAPGTPAQEAAEVERWREHLRPHAHVRAVLSMDAFARCWVQELTLLQAIEQALPAARQPLMTRLCAAWQTERLCTFEASVEVMANTLAQLAHAREVVPELGTLRGTLRQVGQALGLGKDGADSPQAQAQKALLERLDSTVRSSTTDWLRLHALEGQAQADDILARVGHQFEQRERIGTGKAALWGGVVSGALTGLGADLATGGLSLGGGMITGGILGALGALGLAHGLNLVRGANTSWLGWQPQALHAMTEAAVLRYLAVAHFGRGRGQWTESEAPVHWQDVVAQALAPHRTALETLWGQAQGISVTDAEAVQHHTAHLSEQLRPVLRQLLQACLQQLYPGVSIQWSGVTSVQASWAVAETSVTAGAGAGGRP